MSRHWSSFDFLAIGCLAPTSGKSQQFSETSARDNLSTGWRACAMQYDPVFSACVEAERVWRRLLKKNFGREAEFLCTTEIGRGEPGSALRAAYDRYQRAYVFWLDSHHLPASDSRWIRDQR
jgi:hypothetical protein